MLNFNQNDKKEFIKTNAYWIYEYINAEVLKDIGVMNSSYFINLIKEIFSDNINQLKSFNQLSLEMLPYSILTLINGSGNMTYTSLRSDTIDFTKINKEALTYYNYLHFSLRDDFINRDFLGLELMQSKIGGMPINGDIVKYTKEIPLNILGLSQYIHDNKEFKKVFIMKDSDIISLYSQPETDYLIASKNRYIYITDAINKIFETKK